MTSPDGLPEFPGIDKADGLKRMMGKTALYEKVLRDFYSRFAGEAEVIQAAIASGDFTTAERRAHSVKRLAATIGAGDLQYAAREVEILLGRSETPPAPAMAHFEQALRKVIDGIAVGFGI